jgi:hypothetical protein
VLIEGRMIWNASTRVMNCLALVPSSRASLPMVLPHSLATRRASRLITLAIRCGLLAAECYCSIFDAMNKMALGF